MVLQGPAWGVEFEDVPGLREQLVKGTSERLATSTAMPTSHGPRT